MSAKEDFLAIKDYEEYDKRRDEFNGLDWSGKDKEVSKHWSDLMPKLRENYQNEIIEEAFHTESPRKR